MSSLLWPLYYWSAWSQPANVLAGRISEVAFLASFRLVGVSSARKCGGVYDRRRRGCCLFSHCSVWDQPATVVAGTIVVGAALVSVRLVGVGPATHSDCGPAGEGAGLDTVLSVGVGTDRHCGGELDICARYSGL